MLSMIICNVGSTTMPFDARIVRCDCTIDATSTATLSPAPTGGPYIFQMEGGSAQDQWGFNDKIDFPVKTGQKLYAAGSNIHVTLLH